MELLIIFAIFLGILVFLYILDNFKVFPNLQLNTDELYELADKSQRDEAVRQIDSICEDINDRIVYSAKNGRHHIAIPISDFLQYYYDKHKGFVEAKIVSKIDISGTFRATCYKNVLGIYWYK